MGYILDKYVKNKEKKFWIGMVRDIVLIAVIIYFTVTSYNTFVDGYRQGFAAGKIACFFNVSPKYP